VPNRKNGKDQVNPPRPHISTQPSDQRDGADRSKTSMVGGRRKNKAPKKSQNLPRPDAQMERVGLRLRSCLQIKTRHGTQGEKWRPLKNGGKKSGLNPGGNGGGGNKKRNCLLLQEEFTGSKKKKKKKNSPNKNQRHKDWCARFKSMHGGGFF